MKPFTLKCTIEEHHKHEATGSSLLRVLTAGKSPAHFFAAKNTPDNETPAKKFGNDFHVAVLEPKLFKEKLIVEPVFGGTGSRLAKETWHLENHGKRIVKALDLEDIEGMLRSISAHKQASKLIVDGHAEESIFWNDRETGVALKCRPDYKREGHILIDVKSTADASREAFTKDILKFQYHVQAAMYLDGVTELTGQEFDKFIIIACEKENPYGVNCFVLGQETLEEGRALYRNALNILQKCQKANNYPNYDDSEIIPIGIPTYGFRGDVR